MCGGCSNEGKAWHQHVHRGRRAEQPTHNHDARTRAKRTQKTKTTTRTDGEAKRSSQSKKKNGPQRGLQEKLMLAGRRKQQPAIAALMPQEVLRAPQHTQRQRTPASATALKTTTWSSYCKLGAETKHGHACRSLPAHSWGQSPQASES